MTKLEQLNNSAWWNTIRQMERALQETQRDVDDMKLDIITVQNDIKEIREELNHYDK